MNRAFNAHGKKYVPTIAVLLFWFSSQKSAHSHIYNEWKYTCWQKAEAIRGEKQKMKKKDESKPRNSNRNEIEQTRTKEKSICSQMHKKFNKKMNVQFYRYIEHPSFHRMKRQQQMNITQLAILNCHQLYSAMIFMLFI